MQLIVETGQRIAGANTYATLVDAAAYHSVMGNAWDDYTEDQQTAALLIAARSVEVLFGPKYLGNTDPCSSQGLLFPRYCAFMDNVGRYVLPTQIPQCLKDAQCEVAWLAIQGIDVFPADSADTAVQISKVSVDVITEELTFYKPVASESFVNFEKAKRTLSPLLRKPAATVRMRA